MDDWLLSLHGLEEIGPDGVVSSDGLRFSTGSQDWILEGQSGEAVTLVDGGGMTVFADLDDDGEIDHISTVHHDGRYEVYSADPHRAAWGLEGGESEKQGAPEVLDWGLNSSLTPEIGANKSGKSQQNCTWRRIEQG